MVIATLILPNTAVLGDSAPSTPDDHVVSLPAFKSGPPSARPSLAVNKPGPLKSIVDDLRDRVSVSGDTLVLCTSDTVSPVPGCDAYWHSASGARQPLQRQLWQLP